MPSTSSSPLPDIARALQRITTLLHDRHSMDTLLQAVVDETKTALPGAADASITVLIGSRPATAGYSGQLALELDETQYEEGHGPCLHAATTGELVEVVDTRTELRWPDHMRRAAALGCLSSLSVPLPMAELSGALNVYSVRAHGFDEETAAPVATLFAESAAASISNMRAYQDAQDTIANLTIAIESRAVIDQAKGIVMERRQLTADQAFQLLAETSQRANVKLRVVADHLIRTGELMSRPESRPPRPRRRT
jgi:GAF domain-containing protein